MLCNRQNSKLEAENQELRQRIDELSKPRRACGIENYIRSVLSGSRSTIFGSNTAASSTITSKPLIYHATSTPYGSCPTVGTGVSSVQLFTTLLGSAPLLILLGMYVATGTFPGLSTLKAGYRKLLGEPDGFITILPAKNDKWEVNKDGYFTRLDLAKCSRRELEALLDSYRVSSEEEGSFELDAEEKNFDEPAEVDQKELVEEYGWKDSPKTEAKNFVSNDEDADQLVVLSSEECASPSATVDKITTDVKTPYW